jgi:hypothetical protein
MTGMRTRRTDSLAPGPSLLALAALVLSSGAWAAVRPPDVPAVLTVSVRPEAVAPGETARVRIDLAPVDGIKINRYPQIKLVVPARSGVVAAGEVKVGDSRPPSPEKMESGGNYFATVDPVELDLAVDAAAKPGQHDVEGELTYFYCVTKDGFFCAPKRVKVAIPLRVR